MSLESSYQTRKISGSWYDSQCLLHSSVELDDPYGFLPAEDNLLFYDSVITPNIKLKDILLREIPPEMKVDSSCFEKLK